MTSQVRISACIINTLQTGLTMHFKPWLLQKGRQANLLSPFLPWLRFLRCCDYFLTYLLSKASDSIPRNSSKVFLFLHTTFCHPFRLILTRQSVLPCCWHSLWEPHPVITWREMVLALLFTPKLTIFLSQGTDWAWFVIYRAGLQCSENI